MLLAVASLAVVARNQSSSSSVTDAVGVSASGDFGFREVSLGALSLSTEAELLGAPKTPQATVSLTTARSGHNLASPEGGADNGTVVGSSGIWEPPDVALNQFQTSKLLASLDKLRAELRDVKSLLKESKEIVSVAPDVEMIVGKIAKAISEFDLETGTSLLQSLKNNSVVRPTKEGLDGSLNLSDTEDDQIAVLNLLGLVDLTINAVKLFDPVVPEGNELAFWSGIESTQATPLHNGNSLPVELIQGARNGSSQIASKTIVPTAEAGEVANAAAPITVNSGNMETNQAQIGLAGERLKFPSASISREHQSVLRQESVALNQVMRALNVNGDHQMAGPQPNSQVVAQHPVVESVVRLASDPQVEAPVVRSTKRSSNWRPDSGVNKVVLDPRVLAALATTGVRSNSGPDTTFTAAFQFVSMYARQNAFGFAEPSSFRNADLQITSELSSNGGMGGFPTTDEPRNQSTVLNAQSPRSSGFSLALTEQLRAIKIQDGVTKVQLSPRGLGIIEVEVITDTDNTTNIVIRSDNAVVLTALKDVRELVSQVLNLESGSTLNFEESTGNGGSRSGDDSREQAPDFGVSHSGGSTSDEAVNVAVINGDQLDITA